MYQEVSACYRPNNKVNIVSNHIRILTLCFTIALLKRHR